MSKILLNKGFNGKSMMYSDLLLLRLLSKASNIDKNKNNFKSINGFTFDQVIFDEIKMEPIEVMHINPETIKKEMYAQLSCAVSYESKAFIHAFIKKLIKKNLSVNI